ncbi:hypothetical protein EYF80_016097 [Liparis tanakae]|uniref:Uncharacterized protein n=1 Tax=Liparis tanakae TaxID=230148 RepID=A0A4Z2I6Q3_9TELE|nr:hypothetical protein EYF80_016097 [Liparis tanakae]
MRLTATSVVPCSAALTVLRSPRLTFGVSNFSRPFKERERQSSVPVEKSPYDSLEIRCQTGQKHQRVKSPPPDLSRMGPPSFIF